MAGSARAAARGLGLVSASSGAILGRLGGAPCGLPQRVSSVAASCPASRRRFASCAVTTADLPKCDLHRDSMAVVAARMQQVGRLAQQSAVHGEHHALARETRFLGSFAGWFGTLDLA